MGESINNKPYLDRSKNIGNTDGADGKGRIHTKVANDPDEPVPSQEAGLLATLSDYGTNPGSAALVTLFDIPLLTSSNYKNLDWVVSCFRDVVFTFVHIDDVAGPATENVLAVIRAGSNQYNSTGLKKTPFVTGGAGSQVLRVRAQNITSTSQFDACVSIQQFV